jgi:creatinine amidohydrolase
MNSTPSVTRLCIADDATFWPWHRWPEFHRWPDRESTLVVVPLAGSADWGLGHPLDAEETVLMSVLREASLQRPAHLKLLVLPPVRFVLGPDAGSAFAVDPPLAHGLLAELLASVAASGYRKVVLYNSSPWNEEFIASVARDNRIALGLQLFRISLSGLGLDLHPTRSQSRGQFQTLVTALTGREPETPAAGETVPATRRWGDESVLPLLDRPLPLAAACAAGAPLLAAAAGKLLGLLGEIDARAPLANGGKILPAQI